MIRAAAEAFGVAIEPARQIGKAECQRIAAAYAAKALRQAQGERSEQASVPLKPAPSREECPKCGIPGFKGCAHFLPCEPVALDSAMLTRQTDHRGPRV